jgi:hypothetical protein
MKASIVLATLATLMFLGGCTLVPVYTKDGVLDGAGIKVLDAGDPSQVESVAGQIRNVNRQSLGVAGEILENPLVQIGLSALGVGGIAETTRRVVKASNEAQRKREDDLYDEALRRGAAGEAKAV